MHKICTYYRALLKILVPENKLSDNLYPKIMNTNLEAMARGYRRQKLIEEMMLDREATEGRWALDQFPFVLLACMIMCTLLLNHSCVCFV